jgi:hypothetical protein
MEFAVQQRQTGIFAVSVAVRLYIRRRCGPGLLGEVPPVGYRRRSIQMVGTEAYLPPGSIASPSSKNLSLLCVVSLDA